VTPDPDQGRQKSTKIKSEEVSCFKELDVLRLGLEAFPRTWKSSLEPKEIYGFGNLKSKCFRFSIVKVGTFDLGR
jgi:hypothetical protein